MIRNHIKLAWRNLKKNRLFSTINLSGLTLGLIACLCVISVVLDDFSYDSHWSRKNDIHRLLTKIEMGDGMHDKMSSSWAGMRPALMDNFPEVEAVTNIYKIDYHIKKNLEESSIINLHAIQSDTLIWELFDFKILSGNPKTLVHGQSNLVLTKSLKEKLFPLEDAVGKIVYDIPSFGDEPTPFLITGVIEDIPNNTHLRAEALVLQKGRLEMLSKKQYGTFMQNYVLFKSGTNVNGFTEKLNAWYENFVGGETKFSYEFQPIEEVYMNSEFDSFLQIKGNRTTNYILLGIAILLLIIACVNFINLNVARSLSRLKEIGVRKAIGAPRKQIMIQFLIESLLYFTLATCIALPVFYFIIPLIEQFINHPLQLSLLSDGKYLGLVFITVFLISGITGMYPALLISGFKPVNSLRGKILTSRVHGQQTVQKGLVIVQFSIAIAVLVGVLVVRAQLDYVSKKDLGYDKENLLAINPVSWNGKGLSFYNEVMNLPSISSASLASWRPTTGSGNMSKAVDNPSNPGSKIDVWFLSGDVHLAKTLGFELVSGRFFNEDLATDVSQASSEIQLDDSAKKINKQPSLLTEYTAGLLGVTTMNTLIPEVETTPVGILKNFHTESLREGLQPVVLIAQSNPDYSSMLIRVKEGSSAQAASAINEIWKEMFPNKLLDTNWVDDLVAQQYIEEERLGSLFTFFSILSLLLAAMGIFGLVAQSTQQRIKEIGVRKTLGASISSIVVLFSKSYVKLVFIALVFALPIAWYGASRWLENFEYRIAVGWQELTIAATLVMISALLTVTIQSVKAAMINPAKSLKTE